MNKRVQRETKMENNIEMSTEDLFVKSSTTKNFVIQLGRRIQKVSIVNEKDHIKVNPKGWIEKQTWREINDILRLNGFSWFSNGKDSFWIAQFCDDHSLIFLRR